MKNKIPVNVSTSRGCFSSCLFCSVAAFWRTSEGVKWRGRSINNIVDELEQLYHKGARYFKFVDDSFIEPLEERNGVIVLQTKLIKEGWTLDFE